MPFTISHAAAVLPLHRWTREKMPLAALMIGSMSPDFSYFTDSAVRSDTHSFLGLFTFCWPVGLALWLVFVRVLEQPTLALMPQSWAARIVPPRRDWSLRTLVVASVAVILGAVTHLVWDAFTHPDTHATHAIPALKSVVVIFGAGFPWFWILQHLSTIFGLVVLTVWAVRKLRSPHSSPLPHALLPVSNRMRVIALVFVVSATLGAAIYREALYDSVILEIRLFHLVIGGMTGFALAWLAVAVMFHVRTYARSRASRLRAAD